MNFNPNGIGLNNGHFIGLPFSEEEATVVVVSVPWDVTTSFGDGTSSGPTNILQCSTQLDLFDNFVKDAWKLGIYVQPCNDEISNQNNKLRAKAKQYIEFLEQGGNLDDSIPMQNTLVEINQQCNWLNKKIEVMCQELMAKNKFVGIVGGDHSSPLGLINALSKEHCSFGILHIDAHMDLRHAYEGFVFSHASIFYNVLQNKAVEKIVQVGVRDFCDEEYNLSQQDPRIVSFTDSELKKNQFNNTSWNQQCQAIIDNLPQKVYISFDIDGLKPELCPNTGTPVPGGLEYEQAIFLCEQIVVSGRQIIGFDLCEVAGIGNDWDGNVGARILYKLCNCAGKSNLST